MHITVRLFGLAEAHQIGKQLGDLLSSQASSELIEYLNRNNISFSNRTIQQLAQATAREIGGARLGIVKRIVLLSAFRSVLIKNGFNELAVEKLATFLDRCIHAQSHLSSQALTDTKPIEQINAIDESALKQVQFYMDTKQYPKAESLFSRFAQLAPRNAEIAANHGVVLIELGRASEGRRELERAITLNPSLVAAYINLASLFLWQGAFDSAEKTARHALKLDAKNAQLHIILGNVLVNKGQHKLAEKALKTAQSLQPDSSTCLTSLGALHAIKGNREEAQDYYARTLKLEPTNVDALCGLMSLNVSRETNKELSERIRNILNKPIAVSAEVTLRHALGDYLDRIGEFSEAFACYKKLMS